MSDLPPKDRRLDVAACLEDMLDCVEAIQEYTEDMSHAAFEDDAKTLDAVLRRLEVLGEAAGRLLRLNRPFPTLALREIYDMRNALIHGYDGIDVSVVWKTVLRDIPILRQALTEELAKYDQGDAL